MSNEHQVAGPQQQGLVERLERSTAITERKGTKVWRGIESVLLCSGLVLVMVYGCARMHSELMSRAGVWSFKAQETASRAAKGDDLNGRKVDFSGLSGDGVKAYTQALSAKLPAPLAVLSIPRLGMEIPVFEGTDGLTLNRGAGRIKGTAMPGEPGNIGIAAHRDGFFRSLKNVHPGDRIELAQLRHRFVYTVDTLAVVDPSNVSVLQARSQPSLTLVTCYPFYFIGGAPRRYIVQASLADSAQTISETDVESSSLYKEKMQ
jgi:sortase A